MDTDHTDNNHTFTKRGETALPTDQDRNPVATVGPTDWRTPSENHAQRHNHRAMLETDLYAPVKTLLEQQGYTVKGEIGKCDVVAVRGEEPPVIVELKTGVT
ncbi:MAG: hypothetical protein AB8G17_13545, partial [Gammaproteobacteria bacterium]